VPEFATVRCIITAQVQDGSHKVIIDEQVEPAISDGKNLDAGHQLWRIWGSDGIPQLPADGSAEYADTMFAPPGGFRVQMCEFPAETGSSLEARGVFPGLGTALGRLDTKSVSTELGDINDRIMHYTDSVDIMVVLEGECGFLVEGGDEITLRAGDVLINNGVAHSWRNGPVPCKMCMIAQGAVRSTTPIVENRRS
jgi:hypothetical protein